MVPIKTADHFFFLFQWQFRLLLYDIWSMNHLTFVYDLLGFWPVVNGLINVCQIKASFCCTWTNKCKKTKCEHLYCRCIWPNKDVACRIETCGICSFMVAFCGFDCSFNNSSALSWSHSLNLIYWNFFLVLQLASHQMTSTLASGTCWRRDLHCCQPRSQHRSTKASTV